MKKTFKYIISALTFVMLFNIAACSTGDDSSSSSGNNPTEKPVTEVELEESEHYLTKNGISEYTIVYPADTVLATPSSFAVTELQTFVYEATGVSLKTVVDTDLTYSESAKYLSIGQTEVMASAGIELDLKELNAGGYIIKSMGASVFMAGGQFGNLYAVYDFLKYQFGFEVYAPDEIALKDCKKENVKVLEYDLKVIPDLPANVGEYGEQYTNREYCWRLRMQQNTDVFLPDSKNGGLWHNFLGVVYPGRFDDPNLCTNEEEHICINDSTDEDKKIADYPDCVAGDYHPEWFSNGQLNLSSETVDLMVDVVVGCWQNWVKQSRGTQLALTFTHMDTGTWSDAASSKALKEKYGTHSAEQIIFMNKCVEKMNPWLEDNYPQMEIDYLMFAYHETTAAPVKLVNGEYQAIDNEVIMKDNVGIFMALSRADYYYPLTHQVNQPWQELVKQWKAVMPDNSLVLWLYGSYYDNYLVPLDFANCVQQNYQFAKENNTRIMLYQMQSNQNVASDWSRLNMYLMGKLGQNVNADVNKLTDDWFANYFKDASVAMRKMYDEERVCIAKIAETTNKGFGHSQGSDLMSRKYWSYQTLMQFLSYIDEAYEAIEHYKTSNPTLYRKLYDRITLESIVPRYMLLSCYTVRIDNQSAFAKALLNDCVNLGVSRTAEGGNSEVGNTLSVYM